MSERQWFIEKAEECAQKAKEAADPRLRSTLETERSLWLQIAEKLFASGPRTNPKEPD